MAQFAKVMNSCSFIITPNRYVGQVDYEASPEELQALFSPCGEVERVTIICDKATGQSKGLVFCFNFLDFAVPKLTSCLISYAYIQFVDKASIEKALQLDNTTFKGRQLKVYPKRHNLPTFIRDGRGRGGRGGRGGRFPVGGRGGYFYPGGRFPSGRGGRFPGRFPGRGAGRGRGRGGYFYSPY